MRLVGVLTLLGTLTALSGCATLSYPLPKCDGYAKRPLNRSMWEWESGKPAASEQQSSLSGDHNPDLAFAGTPDGTAPVDVAFVYFDEAGSHRTCQAG